MIRHPRVWLLAILFAILVILFEWRSSRPVPGRFTGRVVDSAGNPVPKVMVQLATDGFALELDEGSFSRINHTTPFESKSDSRGRFSFDRPPKTTFLVIAADPDVGIAEQFIAPGTSNIELKLQPWARIEGVAVAPDGKPVSNAVLTTFSGSFDNPRILTRNGTNTSESGSFVVDRVRPGYVTFHRSVGPGPMCKIATTQAIAGQTTRFTIDYEASTVRGRLLPPTGRADALLSLRLHLDRDAGPTSLFDESHDLPPQQSILWCTTEAARAYRAERDRVAVNGLEYSPDLEPDGTFTLTHVRPGKFRLTASGPKFHGTCEFEVPQPTSEMSSRDVRVPDFVLRETPAQIQPGDGVPPLKLPLLDGSGTFDLESVRGRYVLLDFWSTTCAPCMANTPALKDFYDTLGKAADRVRIVAVTFDRRPDAAVRYVESRGLLWTQCIAADAEHTELLAPLLDVGLPTYVVIDPHGRLVARTHDVYRATEVIRAAVDGR